MKKVLVNYGGILLFYLVIVFGVLFLTSNNISTNTKPNGFSTSIGAGK